MPIFIRLIEEQNLGHNNKQNKVPLRNEGVDPEKIRGGTAGPRDRVLWVRSAKHSNYEEFGEDEWRAMNAGRVRL